MNKIYKILRGKVNGKEKYCRIPIRYRRKPIYAEEYMRILNWQLSVKITDDELRNFAFLLHQTDNHIEAGILLTYLDLKKALWDMNCSEIPNYSIKECENK